jgi:hypothetical protein
VCKIIEGVARQTREGAGCHQPISAASQQERMAGSILCFILLPLWSYMVCVLSSQVLSLNSSSLLSVPNDLAFSTYDGQVAVLSHRRGLEESLRLQLAWRARLYTTQVGVIDNNVMHESVLGCESHSHSMWYRRG